MSRPVRLLAGFALALLLVASVLESPWLWFTGLCLLATSILGAAFAVAAARGLAVEFELAGHGGSSPAGDLPTDWWPSVTRSQPIFEGDLLVIKFSWSSPSPITGPIRLTGDVARDPVGVTLPAPTRTKATRSFRLGAGRRGVVTTADWQMTVSDPLGLASVRRPLPGRHLAVIYPAFAELRVHRNLADTFSPTMSTLQDDLEIRGVRPWREGDQRRFVHWPATAKQGNLMVKEKEYIRQPAVGIFLDGRPGSLDTADQIARLAASEAFGVLSEGGEVALWWPGSKFHGPGELATLWDVLEVLARYPEGEPSDELPAGLIASVAVVESDGPAIDALEDVRRRAGFVRVWQVGTTPLHTEAPIVQVGTEWPL